MKILGIDSSGLVCSAALIVDGIMAAEYTLNHKKTHSAILMPIISEIIERSERDLEEIDAIAIAGGPGSFTGLRIGAATAKGLAYSLGKPVISVPTTEALAFNVFGFNGVIVPIMDARRNQVYTGLYTFVGGELRVLSEQRAIGVKELIGELDQKFSDREMIFLGDGVEPYKDIIDRELKATCFYAPPHLAKQRAGSVAVLGEMYYNKGIFDTASEHGPSYLRLSQAERERKEKEDGTRDSNRNDGERTPERGVGD